MKPDNLEFSTSLACLYTVVILAVATGVSALITTRWSLAARLLTPQRGRTGCLDGLRGYLALGVLVHHSFAAYGFFTTGRWDWSTSPVFNQLGQSTVALFFMITGYLFSVKLLRSKERPISWWQLYKSRLLRLTPIYWVSVVAVVLSVGFLTHFELREPPANVSMEILNWLAFVIRDRPDINAFPMTWTVIAGVNWSLQYEWFFYLLLPMMFWPLRLLSTKVPARTALAIVCLALVKSIISRHNIGIPRLYVLHFGCGIASALALRDEAVTRLIASNAFRIFSAACFVALGSLASADGGLAVALTWVIFLSVAAGASMFGLLRVRAAIWLGEISYGIYLIHGMAIYWTLYTMQSAGILYTIGIASYCAVISALAMTVVGVASLSYIYLEQPAMALRGHLRPAQEASRKP